MKTITTLFVCCFFSSVLLAQPSPPSAAEVLKEACATATREHKNVFIIFHASWCGWCRKMDKSMEDPSCKSFFDDNYVIRHLVVDESADKKQLENPGRDAFRDQYHGNGTGIPFWLIFDANGKLLSDSRIRKEKDGPEEGDNAGCPANEKEVDFFVGVLQKTSSLTTDQLGIIHKRFRKNDQ